MIEEVPGVTMEDMEREAALSYLAKYIMPEKQPHEFTVNDAAKKYNMSNSAARRWLDELVEKGVLEKGKRRDPQTQQCPWTYWKKPSG